MLKSNNFNSIIDDLSAFSQADTFEALRPTTLELDEAGSSDQITSIQSPTNNNLNSLNNNNNEKNNAEKSQPSTDPTDETSSPSTSSLAALQLTAGFMQLYSPPLAKARTQLKELIGKQNKIYIDLSAEKFKLDNGEVAKLQDMMTDVKEYREKLLKIKKQMQNIYQRSKELKKRALNIQSCKEKELQKKLQKQQHEESLIAKKQQQQQQQQQHHEEPQ
ncbi:biogenesis of lysosome-related organelles complex 1 subunit 6 [Musca domestica]|uniref:Biogenesis of lysosome-related organelles complex 1 subunit 6 n=1 Tax=Musca domestica TaxID=7370 RepID=A0A9J7DIN3_MUSDO|nr:biogenesis of lysosome-related organelles complex 1 subunit 6 [Musca domestica]XP_019894261.2 biogenesis of lysosome-related organelles complex 1 subunit 6 [Musca domestica]